MYFRKSGHAVVALTVQENPSPPPRPAFWSPPPPGTEGKGNHPSFDAKFLSLAREGITAISQSPCSSMAAFPLATRPAELPAPCCAGVPRKPFWNGFVSIKALRSSPAFVKHGSLNFDASTELLIVA